MNTLPPNKAEVPDSSPLERHWPASLNVRVEARGSDSLLRSAKHYGPLRVQKPYRQTDGSLHVYLLHPPGGVVGGDELNIDIHCGPDSRALFTSPAAGKFYRCLASNAQRQSVRLEAEADAHLEWLPQETIFFDGARAKLDTTVILTSSSTYLGWDIQYLGRRTSGESFEDGYIDQSTRILQEDALIHRERQRYEKASIAARWGPDGHHVIGTLVAVPLEGQRSVAEATVKELQALMSEPEWGITWRGRTMLVRYVGLSAEACRDGFEFARQTIAGNDVFAGRALNETPRIWNT